MGIKIEVKGVLFLRWKYFEFNMQYWENNFHYVESTLVLKIYFCLICTSGRIVDDFTLQYELQLSSV